MTFRTLNFPFFFLSLVSKERSFHTFKTKENQHFHTYLCPTPPSPEATLCRSPRRPHPPSPRPPQGLLNFTPSKQMKDIIFTPLSPLSVSSILAIPRNNSGYEGADVVCALYIYILHPHQHNRQEEPSIQVQNPLGGGKNASEFQPDMWDFFFSSLLHVRVVNATFHCM